MKVQGKTAIVTGAGSGIGRATALLLARKGVQVVVADIDPPAAEETARLIMEAGGTARPRRVDVSQEEEVADLVAHAEEQFGGLDILHNNAGMVANLHLPGLTGFEDMSSARWGRLLDVNLRGVILGTSHALSALRRRGGGVIVNTASVSGLDPNPADPVYAATKAGVIHFTRSLAYLQDSARVRVNCVCPGWVATSLLEHFLQSVPEGERAAYERQRTSFMQANPDATPLQPQDVAEAVLHLIMDDSLNGCAYRVEAGRAWEIL